MPSSSLSAHYVCFGVCPVVPTFVDRVGSTLLALVPFDSCLSLLFGNVFTVRRLCHLIRRDPKTEMMWSPCCPALKGGSRASCLGRPSHYPPPSQLHTRTPHGSGLRMCLQYGCLARLTMESNFQRLTRHTYTHPVSRAMVRAGVRCPKAMRTCSLASVQSLEF